MNYKKFMLLAINDADKYKYTAKPNPVVGAILLKEESIISSGYHEQYGCNHAEINAIENAKKNIGKMFKDFSFEIFFLNFTWSVNISHVTIHTCFCIIIIKHIINSRVFTIFRSITIKFFCIYFYHIQPPPIAPEHSSPCEKNLLGISHSCAR